MKKTPEDLLREEYFDILPKIRKITQELEARIKFALIPEIKALRPHERIEIRSRVKDCESAINALRRRQEPGDFVRSSPSDYTLLELKDLAAARVLVFPERLVELVDPRIANALKPLAGDWEEDHVYSIDPTASPLALKYYGFVDSESDIYAEYQIVPMLIGLFWEVEHAAIYKPAPELKGISKLMHEEILRVYEALTEFDHRFEELIRKDEEKRKVLRRASLHYRRLRSS